MSLQEPHNEDVSSSDAAYKGRRDLESARRGIGDPGTKNGGKRRHVEEVLGAVTETCSKHGIIACHIGLLASETFLRAWDTDLDSLLLKFDALPDLTQSGVKELAYFFRRAFDHLVNQALGSRGEAAQAFEKQIFELMVSH